MLCRFRGFYGSECEVCRLLGYKISVRTSQETHYFSATESSQLMLCKSWSFHGGDYEECRLLGYKIPVRTSLEAHYFSATESSQLMLCKIWGFHGSDYEEWRLVRRVSVALSRILARNRRLRHTLPPAVGPPVGIRYVPRAIAKAWRNGSLLRDNGTQKWSSPDEGSISLCHLLLRHESGRRIDKMYACKIWKVFSAVTMKIYIKPQFAPHSRHITSSLQSPAG
jgi:hypothetical protein